MNSNIILGLHQQLASHHSIFQAIQNQSLADNVTLLTAYLYYYVLQLLPKTFNVKYQS